MFKRSWNKKFGKSEIYKFEDSFCQNVEIDMLKLADGQVKSYTEVDKEYGIVILGGKCTVAGKDFLFENIGERETVFDGNATCVYVPRNTDFTITGVGEVSIAVSKCLSVNDHKPVLIKPEDVISKELGKPGWQRHAMFVLDERVEADQIYIGECWIDGGQWSSYPPHKHDDMNMPKEAATEEIYYYEFDKPQGFGIQKVYTMEGDVDETYTVKSGDFIEIPRGYHPFHAAPGYKNYMLWIMAGPVRGFYMTTDEDHVWLNN
ncbi:MAG: 5-deoxy-glucuronate isomerase [Ruminococcaceae bacterium]|nr:5-deoxy-glucuronate isomerase [Oscillospiraceae bacterium]